MRITNSMMVNQFLNDANESLSRVSKYRQQVDSTKRISHISDDPQATVTALRARNKLSGLDMYQSNITTAKSYLTAAESAADELNEVLQSVYENVVSATGVGKNESDLTAIANELTSLRDEVVSIGNTTIGTAYLFGGFNFTGTKDAAGAVTAPFSTDQATGHLIYNGIDLTQISCADSYDGCVSSMTDGAAAIGNYITELSSSSEEYARNTLCPQALTALDSMLGSGETALEAAKTFGIDAAASSGYGMLSDFITGLSNLRDELSNESSLEPAGDYILTGDPAIQLTAEGGIDYDYYNEQGISVLTDDEYASRFSIGNVQATFDSIGELIENTDATAGAGLDYSLDDAMTALKAELDTELNASGAGSALASEAGNKSAIQVGVGSSVDYTFTGLELLGTGKNNIYYILDNCISMLNSGDTGGLSDMISEIQNAQSSVLNLETKIGATENRLDLINRRYADSEYNYTEMKSEAMDADMAEAIINFTTAKTVYNAALAAGAEIIQTSLIDFLR